MLLGTAVHDVIDEYENTGELHLDKYKGSLISELSKGNVIFYMGQTTTRLLKTLETCLNNYVELSKVFPRVVSSELFFTIPIAEDAELLGRFDQIREDNVIVELKSSKKEPSEEFLNSNIQALVYTWAYKQLYGTIPTYYYVHLLSGTVYEIKSTDFDYLNGLMYRFIDACRDDQLVKEYGSYKCDNCEYRFHCVPKGLSSVVSTLEPIKKNVTKNIGNF